MNQQTQWTFLYLCLYILQNNWQRGTLLHISVIYMKKILKLIMCVFANKSRGVINLSILDVIMTILIFKIYTGKIA